VPLGVGVRLAGGLGVAAGRVDPLVVVGVGVGVPDGGAVPPGVAWAVWRLDGVADGRVGDGSGSAGWVVDWPDPGACAAGLGRAYR
jgi:hypothetical protein